ncbi:ATP-dependent Clp protease ATP-binding subunit, partial [Lactobacillus crispatus]|uniref:ATP-dependent Clp protease ATP-binding subunit n=1 Tax=Lactobacillus crispatus TaxID=47770 RepID=UPI001F08C514
MLCQNCHERPASIHLFTKVDGQSREIDLCQHCYQELKNQQGNQGKMNNNEFFGDFDDLFNALNGNNNNAANNNNEMRNNDPRMQMGGGAGNGGQNGRSLLDQYGTDLTALAKKGKIDPVIGRDKESARVIEILNRRTKNNPVLIGEAGVGKTAVVEGLAQEIVDGSVPAKLQNKRIISLNVVSLVQGTGIRGQFEQRMEQLIKELQQNDDIILFIDEIHEIVGAGNAEGGMDAGNIIKPALARGELQLVGATTIKEYRDIEKDSALARRFQPVEVKEPSIDETIRILKGIQKRYEDYHHVHYTDEAIEAAAKLSARYIQDRFLPDKAIDLLDEAGSRMNLTIPYIDKDKMQERINAAEQLKEEALKNEDYEKAAYYRDQIEKYEKVKDQKVDPDKSPVITDKIMDKIVEEKTGIPVGDIQKQEENQLQNLAADLKAHVIVQDKAVEKVARAIRRNRIGFNKS